MRISASVAWWVYIVECADGSYYTGSTHDVGRRVLQHNQGTGARYTRAHGPVKLLYCESYPDQSAACKREVAIKKLSRSQKKVLIENSHS